MGGRGLASGQAGADRQDKPQNAWVGRGVSSSENPHRSQKSKTCKDRFTFFASPSSPKRAVVSLGLRDGDYNPGRK